MAWINTERFISGNGELSRNSRDFLNYQITGDPDPATDDADNPLAAVAHACSFVSKPVETLAYERAGPPGMWNISVRYASDWVGTGESTFTFNTAGGTQHIDHALSHVQTYNSSGGHAPTSQDGWLGVDNAGNVQGMDRPTAAFGCQATLYVEPSVLTTDYVALLYNLTDTVNSNTFTITADGISITFDPGECRFDGATGSRRGYGDVELTLNWSAAPNLTNVTVAGVPNVTKDGWDVLSVRTQLAVDSTNFIIAPKLQYLFIDQIYERQNFTGLIPGLTSSPFPTGATG